MISSFAIVPPKRVCQSPQGLPRVHPHRRPDARFSSPERARRKGCKPGEPGAPPPQGRPGIVYVQDFKVEKESSTEQESLGGGRARAMIARLKGATEMQSSQVVDLMSSSLVSDLNRGGVKAVRLPAGQPLPKSGWLVRGVFTEVEQGSRALRAEVGFAQAPLTSRFWSTSRTSKKEKRNRSIDWKHRRAAEKCREERRWQL